MEGEATLNLLHQGARISCRMVNLSLGGCCLQAREHFYAGAQVRLEVSFHLQGYAFRFVGVTRWVDTQNYLGVRFLDVAERRREELREALAEVEARLEAKAAKTPAQPSDPAELSKETVAALPAPAAEETSASGAAGQEEALALETACGAPVDGRERRAFERYKLDTAAKILLVKIGSHLGGRILDLSLGGCRISTEARFPVGIYTRVEIEFYLYGLPFKMGGVVQAIHDRHTVGVRFLDMSERKREQVERLIEELKEAQGRPEIDSDPACPVARKIPVREPEPPPAMQYCS